MTAAKYNGIEFKIETVKVEAKSRQLKCKCGSDKSYLTARTDQVEYGHFKLRCDDCIEENEVPVVWGYEEAEPEPAEYHEDVLETVYKRLLEEAIEEMKNEQSNSRNDCSY